jgi:hypothetical protein
LETALESLINPELAAQRGLERQKKLSEQYAPGASLEKVKQAYEERGLFPAVGEAISQIPAAFAEQVPNIATSLGGARLGAMAGAPLGPAGAVVGGLLGAGASAVPSLYAQYLQGQAEEGVPEISRAKALAAAVPGAALEVASEFIPLGRGMIGKLLGPQAEAFLKKGTSEAIENKAKESLLKSVTKGALVGTAAEVPTEVAQQMLGRLQAGQSLTDDEALKEYGEAAYGAALVGGPFGTAARTLGRPAARAEFKQLEAQQEADRVAQEEAAAALLPPKPETFEFPGGYQAIAEEIGQTEEPEGYQIFAEGQEAPLTTVGTPDEVQPKIERLNVIREQEAQKALDDIDRINDDITAARDAVETLEAVGQTQTPEYMQAVEDLRLKEEQGTTQAQQLMEKVQTLKAPLTMMPMAPVTKVQKQYVLTKDGQAIGAFASPQQAEAHVADIVGPEVYEQQVATKQQATDLSKILQPMLKQFGLKDVNLNIAESLQGGAGGSYLNKLITVALDEPNPVQTMRHESVHALKDLGFITPNQWRVLSDRASKEWIGQYLEGQETEIDGEKMTRLQGYKKMGLSDDAIIEEAIADAFGDFDRTGKAPPGMVAAVFKRVKQFFDALRNSLKGAGFQTAEDVFGKIERGELKAPAAQKAETETKVEKASLPTIQPITLNTSVGRAVKEYSTEFIEPARKAVAEGNAKPVTLKDGVKVNLVVGNDKNDKERGGVVALDQEGDMVGRLSFYKTEGESGIRYNPDVVVTEELRRKGLATAMYDLAEEHGALIPSLDQYGQARTEEGQAFRKARAIQETAAEAKASLRHINKVAKQLELEPDLLKNTSIQFQTGKTGEKQFKTKKIGELPKVVQFLEKRRRDTGLPVLDIAKPEDRNVVADLMAAEAMASINAGGNALQWYDETVARTIGMAALKYPELATDPNARMAFKIATAIASQGLNVEDNLTFADKQYQSFRDNKAKIGVGQFNEVGSGADAKAMVSNFKLANEMIRDYGENALNQFLQTEFKVEDLRAAGFNIGGELGDEMVTGSAIFGPKIGFGFYSNLSGNFEPVTMDMWFMRLIGRLTGKLKEFDPELFKQQMQRFQNAFEEVGDDGIYINDFKPEVVEKAKTDEASAIQFARLVSSVFNSDFINNRGVYDGVGRKKTELVYAAQSIIGSVDSPADAPKNGTERRQLRDIVAKTVDKVHKAYGKRIPPAALQALVWYPEQELYKSLGVRLRVTSQDYAGAMSKILKKEGYDERSISAAAQSGARQLQRLAVQPVGQANQPTGQKPTAALAPKEREEFLEKARTTAIVKQERVTPKLHKVVFEVAPDPNNLELTNAWRDLGQDERLAISERVAKKIVKQAMSDLEIDGVMTSQVGSYIDDTNPSFALFLKKGSPIDVAKYLGFALSQDSMVALSPKPAPGLSKIGAVVVDVKTQNPKEIDDIYQTLREIRVNGDQPVGGQSTMNGKMILLNYSNVDTADLANLIDQQLGGKYDVEKTDVFSAYPEKKDYDYASPRNDPRGKGAIVRERARSLRAQATLELAKELGEKAPEPKLSLRSEQSIARPSTGGGIVLSPTKQEDAVSFVGVHYGNSKVDTLNGDKYGTGIRGAERRRLDDGWDDRIRRRVYFYVPKEDGTMPLPEAGLGQYVYSQQFDNILGPGPAMSKLFTKARGDSNEFESAVVDAGYDGYAVPSMGMMVVLNHNAPVNYVGTRAEIAEGKAKLSLKTSFPSAKAAEEATKDLKAPDTREFKLFQGGSQLKNEDGSPKLMFHGSKNIFFEFKENAPIFVADDAETAEYFSRAFKGQSKLQDQIYPLWVRAETPFDFANMGHVDALVQKVGDASIHDKVLEGDWRTIEKPEVQKALKELGFDSFYVNEERTDTGAITKNLAVFKATQVKSATGNFGDFETEKKDIRFSLPTISAGTDAAVGRVTTVREEKGWADRLLGALAPEMFSAYRQAAINRYNRLGEADRLLAKKMGGEALLARNSAEAAALMSDNHAGVVASVMGVGNRRGGVPIIKDGVTLVDHSKKGPVAIFAPLAKYGDPKVYQYFQFYSAVKRGARLFQEGRERLIQPADIKHAQELAAKFPEFEDIRKEWVAFNDALVDYQKKAGVLSDEAARQFTMYSDYIPFYRQMDGEQTIGPRIYQSISGVKTPKALKGGEAPLADFLETVVRNTHAAIGAGMKNIAAQRAVKVGKQAGIVHDIMPSSKVSALETISVLEKGQLVRYQANDQLFIDAVKSLNMPDMPFLGILAAPANLLRNLVTRDPGFIMANLLRDSLSSYVTSGTNATPIAGTVINFGKAMKGVNPSFEALMDAGIIGGYEFSANVEQSGKTFSKDLAKKSGKGNKLLTPFTSVWDGLEKATTASDAATRMAIYDRVMQETGDEAEALYRAQEVMNFNRKGSSAVVRILTAAVPFLNARIQGLDVFYRASTGNMNTADAKEIQRKFFVRGMTMMGLSMMYYFAVAGNPDYEDQEEETKDNNWIIPGVGRMPIPFEVGTLFKTVPERIARYYFGTDTGEDFRKAMWRAANGFVPLSPAAYLPQTLKPMLEAMTNYSFFTQREIVGLGMKDVDPEFQVGPGTTALAQFVGKLGLSPIKVDHVIKGYTGTMGMYAVDVMDSIMDQFDNSPKPAKRFEQMPVIKRFAIDPEARGSVTAYYDLKHTVDTTVRTMNLLERSAKPEEYAKYLQENAGVLAIKPYIQNLDKTMTKYRDMRRLIANSSMSSEDKRDALTTIGRAEINLTQNIQAVKRAVSELK